MTVFGTPHRHLAECVSTNDEARDWARESAAFAPSGALVSGDSQTRGRGQRGREWQGGVGDSALLSYIYRPESTSEIRELGLVTALAVADALTVGTSLSPQIKWPNDILLDHHKVAGILVEAADGVVILGIGINVNQEHFPGADSFAYPPTSLRLATGQPQQVSSIQAAVSLALSRWEEEWLRVGFRPIIEECRRRLAIDAAVRRGSELAALTGLSDEGFAEVRLPDGTFAVWSTVD